MYGFACLFYRLLIVKYELVKKFVSVSNSLDPDQALIWVILLTIVNNKGITDNESIISRERAQHDDDLRDDFTTKLNHALIHVCSPVSAYQQT